MPRKRTSKQFDPEVLAQRGGRIVDSQERITRRLMLTIDGIEKSAYDWSRESAVGVGEDMIVFRFLKRDLSAEDSVLLPPKSQGWHACTAEELDEVYRTLPDLLAAWRSR